MGMPADTHEWTVEELWALPEDGQRYEVIDGALLVTPAPRSRHQEAVLELAVLLREYLRRARVGRVYVSPADIVFGPRTLVQPDVFVAPLVGGRKPRDWTEIRRLLLAVEVVSPSTARADRSLKRRLYQRQGVPEYWVVDLDARLVERWRPLDEQPEIVVDVLEWRPDPERPPLPIDVRALFAEVHGE